MLGQAAEETQFYHFGFSRIEIRQGVQSVVEFDDVHAGCRRNNQSFIQRVYFDFERRFLGWAR